MFAKIIAVSALVAIAQAGLSDYATSSISYSSGHLAAPIASHGYAAPAITHSYAAPAITHSYAAPAITHSYAAPAITHSYAAPAPIVSHGYAAPTLVKSAHHEEDYYAHPKYEFSYGVQDGHTGDHKSQHEERDGDVVKGYYTVAEPDGTLRTVHYTADHHNGFNAVVEKSGHPVHPAPAPVYGKAIVAAAPVHYHH